MNVAQMIRMIRKIYLVYQASRWNRTARALMKSGCCMQQDINTALFKAAELTRMI